MVLRIKNSFAILKEIVAATVGVNNLLPNYILIKKIIK